VVCGRLHAPGGALRPCRAPYSGGRQAAARRRAGSGWRGGRRAECASRRRVTDPLTVGDRRACSARRSRAAPAKEAPLARAGRRVGRAGVRPRDPHARHGWHGRHGRHARHGCACRAEVGDLPNSLPPEGSLFAVELAWLNIDLLVLRGRVAVPGRVATGPEPASARCELRALMWSRARVSARAMRPARLRARRQADRTAASMVVRSPAS